MEDNFTEIEGDKRLQTRIFIKANFFINYQHVIVYREKELLAHLLTLSLLNLFIAKTHITELFCNIISSRTRRHACFILSGRFVFASQT